MTLGSILFYGTGRALRKEKSFTALKNKFINNEEVNPFLKLFFFWFIVFPGRWDLNLKFFGEKGCTLFYLTLFGWMANIMGILGIILGLVFTVIGLLS